MRMRFSTSKVSDALRESLIDAGLIDQRTRKPVVDYFEPEIYSGPILDLVTRTYDMEGVFHVGCTDAERPPSFSFSASKGASDTRKGEISFRYNRTLKLRTFLENDSFRKTSYVLGGYVRDLVTLGEAFCKKENYNEDLKLIWNGWSGDYSKSLLLSRAGKKDKANFRGAGMEMNFKNEKFIDFNGIHEVYAQTDPRYRNPFPRLAKGTLLEAVAKEYQEKEKSVKGGLTSYNLEAFGTSLCELMTGFLQIAEKAISPKVSVMKLQPDIMKL